MSEPMDTRTQRDIETLNRRFLLLIRQSLCQRLTGRLTQSLLEGFLKGFLVYKSFINAYMRFVLQVALRDLVPVRTPAFDDVWDS